MRDPTKNLGPIGSAVLTFIGYKQKTDRQTDKPNLYIDEPKDTDRCGIFVCGSFPHYELLFRRIYFWGFMGSLVLKI